MATWIASPRPPLFSVVPTVCAFIFMYKGRENQSPALNYLESHKGGFKGFGFLAIAFSLGYTGSFTIVYSRGYAVTFGFRPKNPDRVV